MNKGTISNSSDRVCLPPLDSTHVLRDARHHIRALARARGFTINRCQAYPGLPRRTYMGMSQAGNKYPQTCFLTHDLSHHRKGLTAISDLRCNPRRLGSSVGRRYFDFIFQKYPEILESPIPRVLAS